MQILPALLLACLLAIAPAPPAAAQAASIPIDAPHVLPDLQQRLLTATGSGRRYLVSIAAPHRPAGATGHPVIYVLDGNAMFLTAAETVHAYARRRDDRSHADAIVVGIGYPPGTDISEARTFDLTPRLEQPGNRHPTGGAADFLAFIENDLKPEIARMFPVDPSRQALMGHSLAGLFVLDALASRPGGFQTYVAMSSSFWFGGHAILPRIAAFADARAEGAAPLRAMLTVGEYEERPRPDAWIDDPAGAAEAARSLTARAQVTHGRDTAARLSRAPAMLVDFVEFAGEDHGTVIPASISRGLDFILAGPPGVPPVPTAEAYMRLGAEGRYRLRMQVRALPDLHRIPWLDGLKASLKDGLDKDTHLQLHEERQRMDAEYGSIPHAVNASP